MPQSAVNPARSGKPGLSIARLGLAALIFFTILGANLA